MTTREESLDRLKEKLTEQQLRKVMTQGYSDTALSVMAEYNTEYAQKLADSRYSSQTFNKLAQAVQDERISEKSYLMIMDHSKG